MGTFGKSRIRGTGRLTAGQTEPGLSLLRFPTPLAAQFPTSQVGINLSSPVKSAKLINPEAMNPNRVTLASIAATLGLLAWAMIGLQSQTSELLAACKQGSEPAACELRLLGR